MKGFKVPQEVIDEVERKLDRYCIVCGDLDCDGDSCDPGNPSVFSVEVGCSRCGVYGQWVWVGVGSIQCVCDSIYIFPRGLLLREVS